MEKFFVEKTIEGLTAASQQAPLVKKLTDLCAVPRRIRWPAADILLAGSLLPRRTTGVPMDVHPHVLIVSPSPALAEDLIEWVVPAGYRPSVATTFESANRQLRTNPQIVITQLRLREYNGLHLAIRAREAGIPAVVVGDADAVLERDAEQLGATFVKRDELEPGRMLALLRGLVSPAYTGGDESAAAATPLT
jgi:CheY-like chemotaxis protein